MKPEKYRDFHSQLQLPYQGSDEDHLSEIFQVLEDKFGLVNNSGQSFIDLGAGEGRVVTYCALNYRIESVGVEINPELVEEGKEKIKELKKESGIEPSVLNRIHFKQGNMFYQDLKGYDYIYLFSLPTMTRYLKKLLANAKDGAIIISYKYPIHAFEGFLTQRFELSLETPRETISTYFYEKG